jgi:hypothetical protein
MKFVEPPSLAVAVIIVPKIDSFVCWTRVFGRTDFAMPGALKNGRNWLTGHSR